MDRAPVSRPRERLSQEVVSHLKQCRIPNSNFMSHGIHRKKKVRPCAHNGNYPDLTLVTFKMCLCRKLSHTGGTNCQNAFDRMTRDNFLQRLTPSVCVQPKGVPSTFFFP
ncbi:hypothetical protein J6590_067134 [Homalodisca vitripennis]|nr:hypothetical protein J6590_067134 [Homalodisca vitripennis]